MISSLPMIKGIKSGWIIGIVMWTAPLVSLTWLIKSILDEQVPSHWGEMIFVGPTPRSWWVLAACFSLAFLLATVTRRKLAFFAGASIALFVCLVVMWVRSQWIE